MIEVNSANLFKVRVFCAAIYSAALIGKGLTESKKTRKDSALNFSAGIADFFSATPAVSEGTAKIEG